MNNTENAQTQAQVPATAQPPAVIQPNPAPVVMGFGTSTGFALMQRAAQLLAASELVPKEYQKNVANCTIALEMASRIGASPLMVMQNLYLVHGKPSWSSQFIIAAVNGTGRFTPLRFDISGEGMEKTCIAWALERATGERLESPPISMDMAKKEGWIDKNGSKWKTMPDLMLRYRAATLFGRLYAPEILMGMRAYEEVIDIEGEEVISETVQTKTEGKAAALKEKIKNTKSKKDEADPNKISCPKLDGAMMSKANCESCDEREGCPAYD
jgi:hypothetical protein